MSNRGPALFKTIVTRTMGQNNLHLPEAQASTASQGMAPIPRPFPLLSPPSSTSPAASGDGSGLQAPGPQQQRPAAPPGLGDVAGRYSPGALEERRFAFYTPRFQEHGLAPPPGLEQNERRYLPEFTFPGAEILLPPPGSVQHRRGPSQQELLEQQRRRPMLEQRMQTELQRQSIRGPPLQGTLSDREYREVLTQWRASRGEALPERPWELEREWRRQRGNGSW